MQEYFQTLGFHANESKVYLALAELGKASPAILAKRIGLPRTTVYSILESLSEKGLVAAEKQMQRTYFSALPPSALSRTIETERANLKEKERAASELEQLVSPFFRSVNFSIPKMQFFEGKNAVSNLLYEQGMKWGESTQQYDSIWWGYQDHTFVEQYRTWLDWYWPNRGPEEKVQLISNRTPIERELKGKIKNREIIVGPKGFHFSSTIWVCGDYIILIMTRQEPHYAFQIKDTVFAANMREMFKMLWTFLLTAKTQKKKLKRR